MDTESEYARASESYEASEQSYLQAVSGDASREDLAVAAEEAALAAEHWSSTAYKHFFFLRDAQPEPNPARDVEIQAEIAEAIAGLWRDLSAAHRQRGT